ncbi:MAG TPA: DUF1214 domain-containing protein [Afifellaceae bacterium]|nr:DUF1214 domain-containing protein [Afifellaceae bacterium]
MESAKPFETIRIGLWEAMPSAGTEEADPYSRAWLARTGELPLGSGEGLVLTAVHDRDGAPLRGGCAYRLVGRTPPARLWTVAVEGADGEPVEDRPGSQALGSDAILRSPDGAFTLHLAPEPRPGNWLSSRNTGPIRLVIRLYDTTARTVTGVTTFAMPDILAEDCP